MTSPEQERLLLAWTLDNPAWVFYLFWYHVTRGLQRHPLKYAIWMIERRPLRSWREWVRERIVATGEAASEIRLLPILLATYAAFCTRVRDRSSRGHTLLPATQATPYWGTTLNSEAPFPLHDLRSRVFLDLYKSPTKPSIYLSSAASEEICAIVQWRDAEGFYCKYRREMVGKFPSIPYILSPGFLALRPGKVS